MATAPIPPVDPRELASSVVSDARLHDVVVVADKVIADRDVSTAELETLKWAKDLISRAESADVVFLMPKSTNLSGTGVVVGAIRKAATTEDGAETPDAALQAIRSGINSVVQGDRNEQSIESMKMLQSLFAVVSRMALAREVQRMHQQTTELDAWQLATTTSLS